jgi:Ca2+-binding RTX toxin-like protein
VTITGGGGSDTLLTNNGGHTINLTGHNAGNFDNITFSGIQSLVGGTGRDAFRFTNNSAVLDGTINGGGGGDFLDYSGYTIPVTVNLATGSATGVDGGKAGGVINIQNVIGGASNNTLTGDAQGNILIGGGGSNVINGGTGASILMGGGGTATVNGGSGNDILIGGTTSFDSSYSALDSLLAEWQSSKTYSQRISDLKNGGGLNGTKKLVINTTVLGGGADTLVGKGPNDWFFEFANDTILGFVFGEQIN